MYPLYCGWFIKALLISRTGSLPDCCWGPTHVGGHWPALAFTTPFSFCFSLSLTLPHPLALPPTSFPLLSSPSFVLYSIFLPPSLSLPLSLSACLSVSLFHIKSLLSQLGLIWSGRLSAVCNLNGPLSPSNCTLRYRLTANAGPATASASAARRLTAACTPRGGVGLHFLFHMASSRA